MINWVNSKIGACPGGRFSGGVWHNVTVYVRGDDVSIELDGKHLVTTKAHYPNRYESKDFVPFQDSSLESRIHSTSNNKIRTVVAFCIHSPIFNQIALAPFYLLRHHVMNQPVC